MSGIKRQAVISAPIDDVWSLVGDPRRHPEWFPRVVEVNGQRFEEGEEYAHWLLTDAQGDTFIDVEMGMQPKSTGDKLFDAVLGRVYFRRWLDQSLDALASRVAKQRDHDLT